MLFIPSVMSLKNRHPKYEINTELPIFEHTNSIHDFGTGQSFWKFLNDLKYTPFGCMINTLYIIIR